MPGCNLQPDDPDHDLQLPYLSGSPLLQYPRDCLRSTSVQLDQSRPGSRPSILRQRKAIDDLVVQDAKAGHHEARATLLYVLPSDGVPLARHREQIRGTPQRIS
jgi:hypothetical protein